MSAGERRSIEIVEVGPRDGLQNERVRLTTAEKVEYINRAAMAGLRRIEVASFVNRTLVPQMADAEEILRELPRRNGVTYCGLVLNARGVERAAAAGVDEVNFGMAITATFNARNQRVSVAESIEQFGQVADVARREGIRATIVFGVSFGCPFEGEVPLERVLDVAKRALRFKPAEIGIADTIGVAAPSDVTERVEAVRELVSPLPVRCHFHNTRNTGLANAVAAVAAGASALDASIGGIGGCPFAPRAAGNIPTEDLFYMLRRMGIGPDLSMETLLEAARWLEGRLERPLPGLMAKAGDFPVQHNLLPIA